MTMINDGIPRHSMTVKHDFRAVRHIDAGLVPVEFKVTINMFGPETTKEEVAIQTRKTSIAFYKLNFWLETFLHEAIVTDVISVNDVGAFANNIIMLPESNDDIFLQALHSKVSAILGDDMNVGEIKLYADDQKIEHNYNHNGRYDLPTDSEYFGGDSYFEVPWWERSDACTFDVNDDYPDIEGLESLTEVLDEYVNGVMEGLAQNTPADDLADIVKVEKWQKPRII